MSAPEFKSSDANHLLHAFDPRGDATPGRIPIPYENRLDNDFWWALKEGSMHFEGENAVHKALLKVVSRLTELRIPYAVVGGMAMFFHGYRRFTDDVDILVSREGLIEVHRQMEGLGYLPPFQGSKHLRDTEYGVRIEFLIAGDYPGDGKPKPVAFPDPDKASVEVAGMRVLQVPRLVELKLASGMTNAGRLADLGDVQNMIRTLGLPLDLADQLDPFVRDKYRELWTAVRDNPSDA
jgi:hypothetical protein